MQSFSQHHRLQLCLNLGTSPCRIERKELDHCRELQLTPTPTSTGSESSDTGSTPVSFGFPDGSVETPQEPAYTMAAHPASRVFLSQPTFALSHPVDLSQLRLHMPTQPFLSEQPYLFYNPEREELIPAQAIPQESYFYPSPIREEPVVVQREPQQRTIEQLIPEQEITLRRRSVSIGMVALPQL